jgi:hypothetical protein
MYVSGDTGREPCPMVTGVDAGDTGRTTGAIGAAVMDRSADVVCVGARVSTAGVTGAVTGLSVGAAGAVAAAG